jgi:hypothetical protein
LNLGGSGGALWIWHHWCVVDVACEWFYHDT